MLRPSRSVLWSCCRLLFPPLLLFFSIGLSTIWLSWRWLHFWNRWSAWLQGPFESEICPILITWAVIRTWHRAMAKLIKLILSQLWQACTLRPRTFSLILAKTCIDFYLWWPDRPPCWWAQKNCYQFNSRCLLPSDPAPFHDSTQPV